MLTLVAKQILKEYDVEFEVNDGEYKTNHGKNRDQGVIKAPILMVSIKFLLCFNHVKVSLLLVIWFGTLYLILSRPLRRIHFLRL